MLPVALWLNNNLNAPWVGPGPGAIQNKAVQVVNQARGQKNVVQCTPTGTAVVLLLANSYRKGAVITNCHATVDAFLGKDSAVSSTTGILLAHAGGTVNDPGSVDAWWVVTASSSGDVRAIEFN